MDRRRLLIPIGGALVIGLAASLAILALIAFQTPGPVANGTMTTSAPAGAFDLAEASEAPPLDLVDHDGRPFSLSRLRGQPVLIYFGYTHCPDVCPATLGTLNEVLEQAASDVRVLLVTVDPERDTVAALEEYVRFLPPAYIGLTGSASAIRTAAAGYGVTYARVDTGSASGYAMAHTADVYLIDRRGMLRAQYPFGTDAEPILADLLRFDAR